MFDETTLRKNITELLNAKWSNIKIADTLSGPGFGDHFTRDEILDITNEILDKMNREIRQENREIQAELNKAIDKTLASSPSLSQYFKRTSKGITLK